MSYIISTDQGGTFVDGVIIDDAGRIFTGKSPTTPDRPSIGILNAVGAAAVHAGITLENALSECRMFLNGTTVTTNAMVERKGSKAGLITTRGFEETLIIGRVKSRWVGLDERELLDYKHVERPSPVVPLDLICGVPERIDATGTVLVPLDVAEAERAIDNLVQQGIKSLAICLLWSFKNSAHEAAIAALARNKYPELYVVASHELVPAMGEYERMNTVAVEAFLGPTLSRYVSDLRTAIKEMGYSDEVLIMQSIGGLSPASMLTHAAVTSLRSGPVGGIIAAARLGREIGEPNVLTADMGGTTLDVGLIVAGEPQSAQLSITARNLLMVPAIEAESIGAGGGSIAWIDAAKALHVGPQSQGSWPGPACYCRGGQIPTVTDANVVLGYIAPENFAGDLKLDPTLAREAIRLHVADPLNLTIEEAAEAILEIVNSHMADLVRRTTVRRGFDPREFVMMAFGGGGPLHAGGFGPETKVRRIIIPTSATVFSALGIAQSDIRHFFAKTFLSIVPQKIESSVRWIVELDKAFNELLARASDQFDAEGINEAERTYVRSVDLRYRSQIHELTIAVRTPGPCSEESVRLLQFDFAEKYERMYGAGSSPTGAVVEIVMVRVDATAARRFPVKFPSTDMTNLTPESDPTGARAVWWRGRGWTPTAVYQFEAMNIGQKITGPAIIDSYGTSIPVAPDQSAEIDKWRNVSISFPQ